MIHKISKYQSKQQDWDQVKSWNYKINTPLTPNSVVYAEIQGEHGEVITGDREYIYYILSGTGKFISQDEEIQVGEGDVIVIPPQTPYNYWAKDNNTLKIILFMDLWDN